MYMPMFFPGQISNGVDVCSGQTYFKIYIDYQVWNSKTFALIHRKWPMREFLVENFAQSCNTQQTFHIYSIATISLVQFAGKFVSMISKSSSFCSLKMEFQMAFAMNMSVQFLLNNKCHFLFLDLIDLFTRKNGEY